MTEVVREVCQQLAEELVNCPEYIRMQNAQLGVRRSEEALRIVMDYHRKYEAMTAAFGTQEEDPEGFKQIALELRDAEDAMQGNTEIAEMMESQNAFNEVLKQVDNILQTAINTGDPTGAAASCTGNCATCGGCSGR
ncbi:MAG: YlbF family regulator [Clostridia bacterium]|nr:YlbF family regulator [Clostridia bacterium]